MASESTQRAYTTLSIQEKTALRFRRLRDEIGCSTNDLVAELLAEFNEYDEE